MIRSMFAGVAGLRTHQQKMDVIGNNIANVNTNGFKSGRVTFKESIYQTINGSSNGNSVYGGSNPSQIGYGSKVGTIDLMFSSGDYEPTSSPTDCMIAGNGFFIVGPKLELGDMVELENGDITQFSLTRMGNFTIDGDGYLVDGNKNVVYGFYPNTDGDEGNCAYGVDDIGSLEFSSDQEEGYLMPIRVQLRDGTQGPETPENKRLTLSDIHIDDNGTLIGTNDNKAAETDDVPDGAVVIIARLAIANVPNPNALEKQGGPYYKAVQNTGTVEAYEPGDGSTGLIQSSGLEMASVDLAKEFSDMITTQRGFQANSKIITVSDEMLQELVNLKR